MRVDHVPANELIPTRAALNQEERPAVISRMEPLQAGKYRHLYLPYAILDDVTSTYLLILSLHVVSFCVCKVCRLGVGTPSYWLKIN